MTLPLDFFETFVLPTVEEWRRSPLDARRATLALGQIDCLADHYLLHIDSAIAGVSIGAAREELRKAEAAVGLARDVHDTHKHGRLSRRSAIITQGQGPTTVHGGAFFGGATFGEVTFAASTPSQLIVVDDSGIGHDLAAVIEACVVFWKQRLGSS